MPITPLTPLPSPNDAGFEDAIEDRLNAEVLFSQELAVFESAMNTMYAVIIAITGAGGGAAAASAAATTAMSAASKTTPVDTDFISLVDSAGGNSLKKLAWASLKEAIATYLASIALPIGQTTAAPVAATTLTTLASSMFGGSGVDGAMGDVMTFGDPHFPQYRHKLRSSVAAAGTSSNKLSISLSSGAHTDSEVIRFTRGVGAAIPGMLVIGSTVGYASEQLCVNTSGARQGVMSANVDTATTAAVLFWGWANGLDRFMVYGSGDVVNRSNSYGAISDIKLKENITDATPKLAKLLRVRVVNYTLKTDPTHKQIGVIAQELEQISPGLVEETEDYIEVAKTREVEVPAVEAVLDNEGNVVTPAVGATTRTEEYTEREATGEVTKSVKYSVFVPMLIKAMQEQQAMIEALTKRLDALETA